jgi:(1->4)-alpha-D-glucan 1-alpha-D-glucosylmutase
MVDDMALRTQAALESRRCVPESTYRLQFHAGFTFRDATRIVPYLRDLGITHCYASPYLKARSGSTHGYDIVDYTKLNPEIGTEGDYECFVNALTEHGLGQILDTVPNHMAVATNDNIWWNDILEHGPASRYAKHFDIAWRAWPRPQLENKVLLPVLGEPYGDVLDAGQLRLMFQNGSFAIHYGDRRFPLTARSYARILDHRLGDLERVLERDAPALLEYHSILTAARNLPDHTEPTAPQVAHRWRETDVIKRRLSVLADDNEHVRRFIEENLVRFNGTPGAADSFDLLDDLLEQQCYRLSYWRVAADEINYRRFFDNNDLAAVSVERLDVFAATHALVLRLLAEGQVDGLRIDHPDGLYDPAGYFARLQEHFVLACARQIVASEPKWRNLDWNDVEEPLRTRLADTWSRAGAGPRRWPLYVVIEKILGAAEPLIDTWAVHGTTGYDFVNVVNGLFVDGSKADAFTRLYGELTGETSHFAEVAYQKKLLILEGSLAGELHRLANQLDRLAQRSRKSRDFTFNSLRAALREVIGAFPVYRSYVSQEGAHEADRDMLDTAVRRATARNPLTSRRVFRFIRDMVLLEPSDSFTVEDRAEQRSFAGKFQQVAAPAAAKGIEDTAFYVYNRLVSLNEVGGEPSRFGVTPDVLHRYGADRQAKWPYALSPLSTHDTKRSEDVRARINVLSESPDEWHANVARWNRLNEPYRTSIDDQLVPDRNEEYLFYQTLVGAWPLEHGPRDYGTFVQRIQAYMEKALHEAKVHTSWINPNEEYDSAVRAFVARVLDVRTNRPFLDDFCSVQRRICHYGLFNSLSQTLLKFTFPGVPDTYQGTEVWDFSLVDPDNRRPVDYDRLVSVLRDVQSTADLYSLAHHLVDSKEDGRIKMFVTWRSLHCRREHPGLFTKGEYLPLQSTGPAAEHLFGFGRRAGNMCAIVAVPRWLTTLIPDAHHPPLGPEIWRDTCLELPVTCGIHHWQSVFTGERAEPTTSSRGRPALAAANLFEVFPVALVLGECNA